MHRFLLGTLVAVALLAAGEAHALTDVWHKCSNTNVADSTLGPGDCLEWSTTTDSNSPKLTVQVSGASCQNTGSIAWSMEGVDCITGASLNEYWSTQDATCGPTATTDDCYLTEMPANCYIVNPASAGAIGVQCTGPQTAPQ